MKQADIRILMAIASGVIIVTAVQYLDNIYAKIGVIALGLYLAYKARFF